MMVNKRNLNRIVSKLNHQTLIAVTKYVGDDEMMTLLNEGIHHFGENRVQVFLKKYDKYTKFNVHWHFIGHLQSKKVKKVIEKIEYLHSLDRMSLADEIQKRRTTPLNCFLEVNISGETQKYGLMKENVVDFFHKIKDYDKINVMGLMGMATHTDDLSVIRDNFQILLDLKDEFKDSFSKEMALSMGMSNDYEIALEMGATHLRIGSLLYEEED